MLDFFLLPFRLISNYLNYSLEQPHFLTHIWVKHFFKWNIFILFFTIMKLDHLRPGQIGGS